MRKFWLTYKAKAVIIFPGGFGTLDEFFEIATLLQTSKISKKELALVLYGEDYWSDLIKFDSHGQERRHLRRRPQALQASARRPRRPSPISRRGSWDPLADRSGRRRGAAAAAAVLILAAAGGACSRLPRSGRPGASRRASPRGTGRNSTDGRPRAARSTT
ncbi:MAG: LOG family protein [Candidatus Moduliflexus flocculans]|nr:LOG family protein [Candidatus Moduliflexus flocculans]